MPERRVFVLERRVFVLEYYIEEMKLEQWHIWAILCVVIAIIVGIVFLSGNQ